MCWERGKIDACCTGLDPTDINNAPFLWHKGEDFKKGSTAIPLMYRMATTADVKPPHGKKFSRYLWKMPVKKVGCLWVKESPVLISPVPLFAPLLLTLLLQDGRIRYLTN